MKEYPTQSKGFTLIELLVVMVVFSIVAYGIFNFFSSQSANITMQNAISQVTRAGEGVTNFMRQEMLQADKWCYADATEMRFTISTGTGTEIIDYKFDPSKKEIERSIYDQCEQSLGGVVISGPVTMAPNVSSVRFLYYTGGKIGVSGQMSMPVPENCTPDLTPPDWNCIENIRQAEAKVVMETRNKVYNSGSLQATISSDDPLTGTVEKDGKIRRLFIVRAFSRNLYRIANDATLQGGGESGNTCGRVVLSAFPLAIASCEADGETSMVRAVSLVKNETGALYATDEGTVIIHAINDPASEPDSRCADATCSYDPTDLNEPVFSNNLSSVELPGSSRPSGVGTDTLTVDADKAQSKVKLTADFIPQVGGACQTSDPIYAKPVVINIKAGEPVTILTDTTLQGVSLAPNPGTINTCMANATHTNGCEGGITTIRAEVLDKCSNPIAGLSNVRFTITKPTSTEHYGTFAADGTAMDTIIGVESDVGVYAASLYAPDDMPPEQVTRIDVSIDGSSVTSTNPILVGLSVCDNPGKLVLVDPASGDLTPSNSAIKACPGTTTPVIFQVQNQCGDAIASSPDSAKSPTNKNNWNIDLVTNIADPIEEAKQVGTLTPLDGSQVVPAPSGNSFQISYKTGGTLELEKDPNAELTVEYCGASRKNNQISIQFTPIAGSDGQKAVSFDLSACPPVSAILQMPEITSIPRCGPDNEFCINPGCPEDTYNDILVRATISSCATNVDLAGVGVLFVANNPNDPGTYPYLRSQRGSIETDYRYLYVFGDGARSPAMADIYVNAGTLHYNISAGYYPSKLTIRAYACFPGSGGLDTTNTDTQCSTLDSQTETTPMQTLWIGQSPSGFFDRAPGDGDTGLTVFKPGQIGVFLPDQYDYSGLLITDTKKYIQYPSAQTSLYGGVVSMPESGMTGGVSFEVRDCDQNHNPTLVESVQISLSSIAAPVGARDSEVITLNETGPDTGLFRGKIDTKRYAGALTDGTFDAVQGDRVQLSYTDPVYSTDRSLGQFYNSGCRYIRAVKIVTGVAKDLTAVTPALPPIATPSDSSGAATVAGVHAFHIEMLIPEMAFYTFSTSKKNTLRVHLKTTTIPDRGGANDDDFITLREQNVSYSEDTNGYFRIDALAYGGQNYVWVDGDPTNLDPCGGSEVCFGVDDTPNVLKLEFDQYNQSGVDVIKDIDCSALIAVRDTLKPIVTLDSATSGGIPLSDRAVVTGKVVFSGTARDGNGTIGPAPAIMLSDDGGTSYDYAASYPTPTAGQTVNWTYSLDTTRLPDGVYTFKVRAADTQLNVGYSDDNDPPLRPLSGLGTITILVNNTPDFLSFITGTQTNICGNNTFTLDTSAYIDFPDVSRVVNFYIDDTAGAPYTTVSLTAGVSTLSIPLNVDNLSTDEYSSHILYAEAVPSAPATPFTASVSFTVDNGPPVVTMSLGGSNPYSGDVTVNIVTTSCYPAASVKVWNYLKSPVNAAAAVPATFVSCDYKNAAGLCQRENWTAVLTTNPTSCSTIDGFTGDGPNAVHAEATNATGQVGLIAADLDFDIDNTPVISSGTATVVSGDVTVGADITDCDGVANGGADVSITWYPPLKPPQNVISGVAMTLVGTPQNGTHSVTIQTNDYPACSLWAGYMPDGAYSYDVTADDNAPAITCSNLAGSLNRCGMFTGTFNVDNQPPDVAITSIDGAAPNSLPTLRGNASVVVTASDCEIMNNSLNLKDNFTVYINGTIFSANFYTISGPGGVSNNEYTIDVNTVGIQSGSGGPYEIYVDVNDGTGPSISTLKYQFYVENRPDCMISNLTKTIVAARTYRISGFVRDSVTPANVAIGQHVTGDDGIYSYANVVTNLGGAFVFPSTKYTDVELLTGVTWTLGLVVPDTCRSCTNCPQTITLP